MKAATDEHRLDRDSSKFLLSSVKICVNLWPIPPCLSRMKSSLCILFIAATSSPLLSADLKAVDDFRAAAAKANAVLTIPDWEQTPEAVEASMKDAIAKANAALD